MITLKDVKDAYEDFSGKGSEICRQLNFIGVGIIWLFSNTVQDRNWKIILPESLILPILLLCLSLALDLLQYIVSTVIWYGIYLLKHSKTENDDSTDVEDSELLNCIPWIFWFLKIGLTIWGYIRIIIYMLSILN